MVESNITINTKEIEKLGFNFAKGVYKFFLWCIFLPIICVLFVYQLSRPIDDCDISIWNRCGLEVKTDAKTGKQYLLSPSGAIIERGNNAN